MEREPPRACSLKPHYVDATLFFTATSGGVRRYLLEKHAWLRERGQARHTLVVPGAADRGEAGGVVEFASPRIPFGAGYRWPVRSAALRRTLAALRPDLLEAADPYVVGRQVARVAAELGVPAVAFCHSDLVGLLRGRIGGLAARAAGAWLRTLYARFDLVLAPSRVVATRLLEAGVERVRVQRLGVDAGVFDPRRRDATLRTRLGIAPDARLLVFAGRLAPEKNLRDLYAAVARLGPRYRLLVIGGERPARPAPGVIVLPYQRDARCVAAMLAACDVFVHAGRQESFGLVALEAMACALPVVAYAAGALPEIVDDAVGALAPPRGPGALADAIDALYARDPAALGRSARERVLQQYSWDAAFTHQFQGYAALLAGRALAHSPELRTA